MKVPSQDLLNVSDTEASPLTNPSSLPPIDVGEASSWIAEALDGLLSILGELLGAMLKEGGL